MYRQWYSCTAAAALSASETGSMGAHASTTSARRCGVSKAGTIHLGYAIGTGEPVEIPIAHTAITGPAAAAPAAAMDVCR